MIDKRPLLGLGTALLAVGVMITGCAGPVDDDAPPKISAPSTSTPTSPRPADMTPDELYRLATAQYRKLFDIMAKVEIQGGALQLPAEASRYAMNPALDAIGDLYREMYFTGDSYIVEPKFSIIAIGAWDPAEGPADAVTALQTCEVADGGAMVTSDGTVMPDDGPAMSSRRGYFKVDPTDGQLKVFILNGEGVDSCPID